MATIPSLKSWAVQEVVKAADLNGNFASIRTAFNNTAVLTDTPTTITVSHTWNAAQSFPSGSTIVGYLPLGGGTLTGTLTGTTASFAGVSVIQGGVSDATMGLGYSGTARAYVGSVSATNGLINGSAAGDMAIRNTSGAIRLSVDNGATSAVTVTSAGTTLTAGLTGTTASFSGALQGGSLVGPLTTAAQPNVTSVGTLTTLTVSGATTLAGLSAAASTFSAAVTVTAGGVAVTGNSSVAGTLSVTGANATTLGGTLGVTGTTNLSAGLTGTTANFSGLVTATAGLTAGASITVAPSGLTDGVLGLGYSGSARAYLGAVAVAGDLITGSSVGDLVLRNTSGATRLSVDNGATSALTVTSTGTTVANALAHTGTTLGFFNGTPHVKNTISGGITGTDAMAQAIGIVLQNLGLVTINNTTGIITVS